jgi:hypothetical protein
LYAITHIKHRILITLREHEGHMNASELAAAIDEPPFRVRAELQDLGRRSYGPLVREVWIRRHLEYELTPAGEAVSFAEQLEMWPGVE